MAPFMNSSREKEYARSHKDAKYIIASFYKFVPIRNLDKLQNKFEKNSINIISHLIH